MADQTPRPPDDGTDPLGERLRATFRAEHADIERRHAASGATPTTAASRNWLPLAAAAAVLAIVAIAGIVLIGNRSGDQAVDLDIAAQPTDVPELPATPDGSPEPQPPTVADPPTAVAAAPNTCSEVVPLTLHFVWDVAVDDADGGLVAHTSAGVDMPITRVLPHNGTATPTGGCQATANGSLWYELVGDATGATDWVNARYLLATEPACVVDGQVPLTSEEPFLHSVQAGDRLSSIADRYNVTVDAIIRANPQMDPNVIITGSQLRIPGPSELVRLSDGPLDGHAVFLDGQVAFATLNAALYQWHEADRVVPGACPRGTPTSPTPTGCPSDEVQCALTGPDDLASLPCERSSDAAALPRQTPAGDEASTADHVHDMTAESNGECTRVVVTFGSDANEDGDGQAATLPPLQVEQTMNVVRIASLGDRFETSFGDTDRVEYPGGIGLLSLSFGFDVYVEFLHRDMEPNVRFFENPARVVIDLFSTEGPPIEAAPFGERFVLRRPLQADRDGPGIPAGEAIHVSGFGRPFEAAGLYRIWSVPADVDVDTFLADPGEPLHEDFFPTGGWAEGWGEFSVELPRLEPGSYIAVFGELPPTDEIGFYGTGQLFRVTDNPTAPGAFTEAVLLPDVQLDPEF